MADPCVCEDPPAVSNGAVTYTGSYINQTRAEYNCDEGYTNSGGSSLVCFVSDDTDCSNSWVTDPDDPTSGTPNCEFEIGVTDVITNNTFNEEGNDTELWVLIGVALFILLLLLLGLLLLCWWFCCRECCRRCCIRSCPCCRQCCYEIPYARGVHPHQVRPAQNGVIYDDPGYHSNKQYASGFEPKHFVHSNSERMQVPQGKPVNSHGQPVWMPHSNNVRSNLKTSTK